MTPTGRTIVACVALVAAVVVALASGEWQGATAALTLVLGYVFGDRNGEKRTVAAQQINHANGYVAELVDERVGALAELAAAPSIDVAEDRERKS